MYMCLFLFLPDAKDKEFSYKTN